MKIQIDILTDVIVYISDHLAVETTLHRGTWVVCEAPFEAVPKNRKNTKLNKKVPKAVKCST